MKFPTKEGEWELPEDKLQEWLDFYKTKNVKWEIEKARQWLLDNPRKQKTIRGMTRYLSSWIARSPDMCIPSTTDWTVTKAKALLERLK